MTRQTTGRTVFFIVLILSAMAMTVLTPASAQSGPPVPKTGAYLLEAELKTWMRKSDSDRVSFHVNQCGDKMTMYHPAIIGESIILNWDGGKYSGSGSFENDGVGSISADLTPVSETRLEGEVTFVAGGFPQTWAVIAVYSKEFTEASEGDPPTQDGMGNIVVIEQETEQQGLFIADTVTRRVSIIQFEAHSAVLTPGHQRVLDAALEDMMNDDSGQPGRACETVEANWASPARGYTDGRFERLNRTTLAIERAEALDNYVAPRFRGRWNGELITGGPAAFGAEPGGEDQAPGDLSCRRAANADYVMVRRYFDMYTDEEAEAWLRERLQDEAWLENLPIDPETGEPIEREEDWLDRTVTALSPNHGNEPRRALAKNAYCFALGVKRLVEDGHCQLPRHSPAEQALMGRRHQTNTWQTYRGAKTETLEAYISAQTEAREGFAQEGGSGSMSGRSPSAEAAEARRRADRVYEYSFLWPQACMDTADAIEKEYYDEATPWDTGGSGAQ